MPKVVQPTVSSHDRLRACLEFRELDRPPIQLYLTPEFERRLQDYLGVEDVRKELGVDFRTVMPAYRGPIRPRANGLFYDMWGVGYTQFDHGRGGSYPEPIELPLARLQDLADVDAYPWPNPDDFDYAALPAVVSRQRGSVVCLGGPGIPDILNGVSRGRGMEQVMMDIATRDPVGMAIIERRCEVLLEVMRRSLEAAGEQIDILHIGEDVGNQMGRNFSPADFDAVFRPWLQRFIDLAHRYDCRAMMHSCGDTHDVQETFIDMGLDILDAMQSEPPGMQPLEALRERTRGRLVYCGLISTQSTLPFGSVSQCRAEARHRLDVIGRGGGYIFAPSHNIQADTPMTNVLAAFEEALGRPLIHEKDRVAESSGVIR